MSVNLTPSGLLGAFLILVISCSDAPSHLPPYVLRDSAGIEIIEIPFPTDPPNEVWALSPEPIMTVGKIEGEEPYLFESVAAARRTADGGLLVLNSGSAPGLRYFDESGDFLRSTGRAGEGPGEFQDIDRLIEYRGDSIAVWDRILMRLSIFDTNGRFGRSVQISPTLGVSSPNPLRALPDGGFLLIRRAYGSGRENVRDGWEWTHAVRVTETGELRDTIAELPLYEVAFAGPEGFRRFVEFGGSGFFRSTEQGFAWVRYDLGELRILEFDGNTRRIIRLVTERVPISDQIWERHLERRDSSLEASGADPVYIRQHMRHLRETPHADSARVLQGMYVDRAGFLWIRRFWFPWESRPPHLILNPDEGWIATFHIPSRATIWDIGSDYIVLSRLDEVGVPRVEVYSLLRHTSAP